MSGFERVLPRLFRWRSGLAGPQHPVNSYVWRTAQGTVLIDPTADLKPALFGQINAPPVTDILITHVQEENIAGCLHFPEARFHVPAGDEYLCEGPEAYRKCFAKWADPWDWERRGNYKGHLAGAFNERPSPEKITLSGSLREGTGVAGCEVLSTPGHGKNAVTLVATIDGKRVAFCGDLMCGDGQLWNWFDSDWDYGLQNGHRSLLKSAIRLRESKPDILGATHGAIVTDPQHALGALIQRLETVLRDSPQIHDKPINFPEKDSPALGWREILPNLHQWRDGNCNVLISSTGNALMVDDGLCYWKPLPERSRHHRQVIQDLKQSLGIKRIEMVVPTHYHGDHTENIPELIEMENAEVICTDVVAEAIEHPERFNLASHLPWYDTAHDSVTVNRHVKSGGRVWWQEFELEFFHLGGQTWYHLGLSVIVNGMRVLFVGDAFHACGGLVSPILCYNQCEPETQGWAYGVERMIEHRPDLLVCGHGSAMRNPMPTLKQQKQSWRQRIAEYRALSARKDPREFFDPFHQP